MKKLTALTLTIGMLLLAGCSSNTPGVSEKYENSEPFTDNTLLYIADGSQGDGPDDAEVTINNTGTNEIGVVPTPTLLPYKVQTSGTEGQKVSMTVQSFASNGEVSCQIMYKNVIIRNEASGNKPTVTCEGILVL